MDYANKSNEKKIVNIDFQKCVGCGACKEVCPVQAIQMLPGWKCGIDSEKCIGCGRCVALCHRKAPAFLV